MAANENQGNLPGEDWHKQYRPKITRSTVTLQWTRFLINDRVVVYKDGENNYKEGYMVEEDPYVLYTSQAGAAGLDDNVLLRYRFGNNVIEADRNQVVRNVSTTDDPDTRYHTLVEHYDAQMWRERYTRLGLRHPIKYRDCDQVLVEVDKNGIALALHDLVNPDNVNVGLNTCGHLIIQGDQPSHVLDALLTMSNLVERGSPATTHFYTLNDPEQHKTQLEAGLGIIRIDGKPMAREQVAGVMAKERYTPGLVIAEAWFHEADILKVIAEASSDTEETSSGDHTVSQETDRPRKRRALLS
ncbi:hypothetical protein DL769_001767 [Monosporascus sp. CRB-8-3]|nr:hypothetical protein DL769_001767 [Monosporascus sp. CRB-8-3]